jgi:G6PDH family F420-dependent oxidoreductase
MASIGYSLSSEEHHPNELVRHAELAEAAGFEFAGISDHFHPWIDAQGHSPFVWNVIGAISHATTTLRLGTGVTCPMIRTHPAVIAQAAATSEAMMPGRFFLGLGTGEALNEHITGERWPEHEVRVEMLEEAVEVIRMLWTGDTVSHRGKHFTVEQARLYTLPPSPPPIVIAGAGPKSAQLAGRIGDGFVSTKPDREVVQAFEQAGGAGKPIYGQATVCWAPTEAEGRRTAHEQWPNSAVPGQLGQDLPTPKHFEQAARLVREDDVADKIVCGPDAERHAQAVRDFVDAGFDHVYVHQIGPRQEEFIRFFADAVMPKL